MGNAGDSTVSDGLNRSQRTGIAVTLEQLERAVDEIERLLDDAPAGATYVIVDDLSTDERCGLRARCRSIREQISELARAFDLPQDRSSVRQVVVAEMGVVWSRLHDLRDGDPARYGGKGSRTAVGHINTEIAAALQGRDASNQAGVDRAVIDMDDGRGALVVGHVERRAADVGVGEPGRPTRLLLLNPAVQTEGAHPPPVGHQRRVPLPQRLNAMARVIVAERADFDAPGLGALADRAERRPAPEEGTTRPVGRPLPNRSSKNPPTPVPSKRAPGMVSGPLRSGTTTKRRSTTV